MNPYGPPVTIHWNHLTHLRLDQPARAQLEEFYDGVYFALLQNGIRCDVGWHPDQGSDGEFVVSYLPPEDETLDEESVEWNPFRTVICHTIEQLFAEVPQVKIPRPDSPSGE